MTAPAAKKVKTDEGPAPAAPRRIPAAFLARALEIDDLDRFDPSAPNELLEERPGDGERVAAMRKRVRASSALAAGANAVDAALDDIKGHFEVKAYEETAVEDQDEDATDWDEGALNGLVTAQMSAAMKVYTEAAYLLRVAIVRAANDDMLELAAALGVVATTDV